MLGDIIQTAKQHGLLLHPDKTKIMSNLTRRAGRSKEPKVDVCGMNIEIVPYAGAIKYLGQMISFNEPAQTEVNHRIKAAWAACAANRQELTSKHYPLKHRLRLFQGTVAPT
eukprot:4341376-Pyramimonas_sp.AAC.1